MERAPFIPVLLLSMVASAGFDRAVADVPLPPIVRYQQQLADASGVPLNGNHKLEFTIYDSDSGGSAIWSEGPLRVTVDHGLLIVLLGVTAPLPPSVPGPTLWVEVTLDGKVLGPRNRVSILPLASAGAANPEEPEAPGAGADTASQSPQDSGVGDWIGKQADEVIAELGPPSKIKRSRKGGRVLIYEQEIVSRWTYHDWIRVLPRLGTLVPAGGGRVAYLGPPYEPDPKLPSSVQGVILCEAETRFLIDRQDRVQEVIIGKVRWNKRELRRRATTSIPPSGEGDRHELPPNER